MPLVFITNQMNLSLFSKARFNIILV